MMRQSQFSWIMVALVLPVWCFGQTPLTGTVRNENGEVLFGVSLLVKGTNTGAVTDSNGTFFLETNQKFPITLIAYYVGHNTSEVTVESLTENPLDILLEIDNRLTEVVINARRRVESAQDIPVPVTVISGRSSEEAGAFNVNRVKEFIPSVQFYTSNPRNTTLNIRGLGSTFGLTNDGIDPGVGFYIDGVYYARPAATTLDFIDIERIEVLRGPQGTLFGKNTTAGAFNINTRKPSFTRGGEIDFSVGNYGYLQTRASITGPMGKKMAARLALSATKRNGTIENIRTGEDVNQLQNFGLRGQVLYVISEKSEIRIAADITRQRPNGFAQVFAGTVPTKTAPYRQFNQIIADLEYQLPTQNPFDRIIDTDTPWKSDQDMGGISLYGDFSLGKGTISSITAFRFWTWGPSNDRDFTGLQALSLSQAPSKHHQWSQEFRYSNVAHPKLKTTAGVFIIGQDLRTNPYHTEESGADQWRFSQNSTSELWKTPGLLDGYGIRTHSTLVSLSTALFGQAEYEIIPKWYFIPGIRINNDQKEVDFKRVTYGGLDTQDPDLIAIKRAVYTNQEFAASTTNTNFSGLLTLQYKAGKKFSAFGTYSTNYKPVGLNLGGLPTANGQVLIEQAEIKPENVQHMEVGLKTRPTSVSTFNMAIFTTSIRDYQTLVLNTQLGVNRGFLANAEKVRVHGIEADLQTDIGKLVQLNASVAYTEGIYVSFKEAPAPIEETGGQPLKDISGETLPGISKWAGTVQLETHYPISFLKQNANVFGAIEMSFRSKFSSSPTPSPYLYADGYTLLNVRAGVRSTRGLSIHVWARNLLTQNYFEQLLPAAGSAGYFAGVTGDPRTFGVTIGFRM